MGTLPGPVHLTVDPEATPTTRPAKRIPIELEQPVKAELNRLVKLGVITPVEEPTDWVNQITVATKKNGSLRICIDPRSLNLALRRERYRLPVLDDVLPELAKAKVFSKVDLSHGYWHCVLDEESTLLTTFTTPFGRFKWLRLPFGLSVSSEIFQKRLLQSLEGLTGIACIADDILIYGVGDSLEEAAADHNNNLNLLMHRCQAKGIKLNHEKMELRVPKLHFMGHCITPQRLEPDPNKTEAILKLESPKNKAEVQRINGTVNYLARFLPRLSEVTQPLRHLTREEAEWQWTEVEERAFKQMKQLVTQAPVLAYYQPDKELTIQCDASGKGLGAALMQEGRPIAYASRALTDPETRYATIEKEMLAVVFALEKWHEYTFGRRVTVHTDHKPLQAIVKKPLDRAPKRLQGMLLRSLAYDVEVTHIPGKSMLLADTMSRSFLPNGEKTTQEEFETINAVRFIPMTTQRIDEIRQHTEKDETLQMLKATILKGWPQEKSSLATQLTPYYDVRDELGIQDGLIFRGERLVIPQGMRETVKADIHRSHTGVEGCLRRARESVYWPRMNADVKHWISTCDACRQQEISHGKETLMSHYIPGRPWEKIAVDLFSIKEKNYLITVDYYSNYWEVDRLDTTKSSAVIRKLKPHFARYGSPCRLVSDNGPQFSGAQFQEFTKSWDIEHIRTSPYHSKSNGKAEAAVKVAKRLLKKTARNGEDQYLALLTQRNIPTEGLKSSPVQRMMNRRTRTLLPTTKKLLEPRNIDPEKERKQMEANQAKQARYYDRTAHDLPVLAKGETVRVKPLASSDKQWRKARVTRRLGKRSYEVETQGQRYTRNRADLRRSAEEMGEFTPQSPKHLTTPPDGLDDPGPAPTSPGVDHQGPTANTDGASSDPPRNQPTRGHR